MAEPSQVSWYSEALSCCASTRTPLQSSRLSAPSVESQETYSNIRSLLGSSRRGRTDSLITHSFAPALLSFWALQETSGIFYQKETYPASYLFNFPHLFNFHEHSAFNNWERKNFQGSYFLLNKTQAPLPSLRSLYLVSADIWGLDFWDESFLPASLWAVSQTHCAFSYVLTF